VCKFPAKYLNTRKDHLKILFFHLWVGSAKSDSQNNENLLLFVSDWQREPDHLIRSSGMISLVHSPLSRGLRVLEPFAFACSGGHKPGHFNFKSLVIYLSAAYVICWECARWVLAGWRLWENQPDDQLKAKLDVEEGLGAAGWFISTTQNRVGTVLDAHWPPLLENDDTITAT